jgi:hypothetical protein
MTDQERALADRLLSQIEMAAGELPRDTAHVPLIAEILEATHGLRSLLGIVRPH